MGSDGGSPEEGGEKGEAGSDKDREGRGRDGAASFDCAQGRAGCPKGGGGSSGLAKLGTAIADLRVPISRRTGIALRRFKLSGAIVVRGEMSEMSEMSELSEMSGALVRSTGE